MKRILFIPTNNALYTHIYMYMQRPQRALTCNAMNFFKHKKAPRFDKVRRLLFRNLLCRRSSLS